MANIDRVVNVQISLRTANISTTSFSDLLLYGEFTKIGSALVGIITEADELLDDYNCETTDAIYKAAVVAFSQIPRLPQIYIGWSDDPEGEDYDIAVDMAAIKAENNDWYAWCNTSHAEADVVAAATWTEANEKLFVTVLSNTLNASAAGGDTTSTAHLLMAGNYFRTAWWYDTNVAHYPDVGITVKSFTKYPGQETWANQRLQGVTNINLTQTIATNIFAKNGNTFEPFRNISITQNGKTAGGEWIDVIRFRDWLCEEIKLRVFQQMIDNRIPYTDPGIAIIRSRLVEALDFGVQRGGIAPPEVNTDGDFVPSFITSVPLSTSISANTKASRVLQDVTFTARLAGAIHVVEIKGALTYENLPVGSVPVIA